MAFVTNVSVAEAAEDGSWGKHAIKSEFFFEASQRQRIMHGAGSRECVRFYGTEGDCTQVFPGEARGMFALTQRDTSCCLDMPDLRTPPANWTVAAKYHFVETRRIKGRMCHGFRYLGFSLVSGNAGKEGHTYWQDSVTHLPCAIEFIGDEQLAWFFDVDSLKTGSQDDKLFAVPDTCSAQRCKQH